MFVWYESSERSMHTCIFCYSLPSLCHWTAEQQSLHITGFLRVIYAILNGSVILKRNEKCLKRNEKRLERSEPRLARNETRGGNLLLGGTVYPTDHQTNYISAQTSTRELYKCEHAIFERDSPLKRQIFFTTFNFKGAQNSTSLLPIWTALSSQATFSWQHSI